MALAPGQQQITFDTFQREINKAYEQNLGRPADIAGLNYYMGEIASGNKNINEVIADLEYAGSQLAASGQQEYIDPGATYYEPPDEQQQTYIDTRIQAQEQAPVEQMSFEELMQATTEKKEIKNINDLYDVLLDRPIDASGVRAWKKFGSTIEPDEIVDFVRGAIKSGEITSDRASEIVSTYAPEAADLASREFKLTEELRNMYGIVVDTSPTAKYGGRQSDLTTIHSETAKKLAEKGVANLAQLTEATDDRGRRFVVNKDTGESLFQITKDRDTGADKWGGIYGGVKDSANLSIYFDSTGRAVLFPVHEKTKGLAQQLLGRDLAALVEPVATVVGAYYGGPAGAAIGSSLGQLATTGKIEPEKVALAAATTYISSEIASADYATKVGNAMLPTELANSATAKIVGNAVVNSGVSGLIASVTGGNVEQSMVTGAIVGGAIASAPDIANTLMGGEANVKAVADATGLGLRQTQDIIASSIADAVVADAQNRDGFGSALGASLVARGVGTAAANKAVEFVGNNFTQNPEALAVVFNGTKGIAQVATEAAVRGQDVEDAVKFAAPGIVLQAGLSGLEQPQTDADRIAAILEEQLQQGGIPGEGVQVAGADGVSGLFGVPPELEGEISVTEDAIANAQDALEMMPNMSEADRSNLMRFINETQSYLDGLYQQVSRINVGYDMRQFSGDAGGKGYALVGGGGTASVGNAVGWNFIGVDSGGNQQFNVGDEVFTLFVMPNNRPVLASTTSELVFYPDFVENPATAETELVLNPTNVEQVQVDVQEQRPPEPVKLEPGPRAEDEEGATGAEGAAGTPGGATPGTLQEALALELRVLENRLQDAARERQQAAQNLANAVSQRERLSSQGLETALGPDLTEMLDAEIATLEAAERSAAEAESAIGTQIRGIGATQQEEGEEGGRTRPSSEVIGDLVRGGFGDAFPSREGDGTGGVGGGEGSGAGTEGTGPGAGTEGTGLGAGETGTGPGGGGEDGAGGGEESTPLRPVTIFDTPTDRPAAPFASRVTGEALAGILGAKEPLFGGDPDEQRAVWNRRSLRLRRALGL